MQTVRINLAKGSGRGRETFDFDPSFCIANGRSYPEIGDVHVFVAEKTCQCKLIISPLGVNVS